MRVIVVCVREWRITGDLALDMPMEGYVVYVICCGKTTHCGPEQNKWGKGGEQEHTLTRL